MHINIYYTQYISIYVMLNIYQYILYSILFNLLSRKMCNICLINTRVILFYFYIQIELSKNLISITKLTSYWTLINKYQLLIVLNLQSSCAKNFDKILNCYFFNFCNFRLFYNGSMTEKSFLDWSNSKPTFRLAWNLMEFHLIQNQSENDKYNLITVY